LFYASEACRTIKGSNCDQARANAKEARVTPTPKNCRGSPNCIVRPARLRKERVSQPSHFGLGHTLWHVVPRVCSMQLCSASTDAGKPQAVATEARIPHTKRPRLVRQTWLRNPCIPYPSNIEYMCYITHLNIRIFEQNFVKRLQICKSANVKQPFIAQRPEEIGQRH